MEKNTKLLLGAAVLGVGGYLYWKSKQQPKAQFLGLGKNKKKKMAGFAGKKMVGANGKIFTPIKGKTFKGANGKIFTPVKGKTFKGADGAFFDTQSSKWLREDGEVSVGGGIKRSPVPNPLPKAFTGKMNVQSTNW